MINKKYNVTAKVLTPLSIGQGSEKDWVYGIDYLTKEDEYGHLWLYHLDLSKMVAAGVDVNKMAQTFACGNPGAVNLLVGPKLEEVSDCKMRLPVSSEDALSNPIKTFLRNQLTDRPVLAGSSLKGALRSILFSYLVGNEEDKKRLRQELKFAQGSINLNNRYFGDMTKGTDFMRFIRVGDFEFEETGLVNTKIFNLHQEGQEWDGGWKHSGKQTTCDFSPIGFNTIYECLLPNAVAQGAIMFADTLFDQISQQPYPSKKRDLMKDSDTIEKLCEIVKDATFDYLNKELDFFVKYWQGINSTQIRDAINAVMDEIDNCNSNECVLKMSAGSGFHSITGDWQYNDYTDTGVYGSGKNAGKKKYKSRKIAVSGSKSFSLMGFIKLTFN